ncbi:MAG: sulfatase, partial [Planctomycetota bacterium]
MKHAITIVAILFALPAVAEDRRPNILLLMADGLNTSLSGFGHEQCKTPHLDRLVQSGMRFENMHCQYPVCGASRASLMTGLYPYSNGMLGNSGNLRKNLPDVITMSQLFRNQGYHAGRVSKIFHMGIPGEIIAGTAEHDDPLSWDESVNVRALEQNATGHRKNWSPKNDSSQAFVSVSAAAGDLEHADGMAATAAIDFLKRNRDQSFFLGCGFVRPHVPLVAPEKYFEQYERNAMLIPRVPENDLHDVPMIIRKYKSNASTYGITPKLHKGLLQSYYASVSYMDAQVGRVLDALSELGLEENTIVIFTSDHGYLLGQHNKFQKQHLFEEATRVPFILRVPWLDDQHGQSTQQITELVDVYPTIAELAGIEPPSVLQGRSMVPLLKDPGTDSWERKDAFSISRSGGESLRTDRWRFTQWGHGSAGEELYDRQADPGEFRNLAHEASLLEQKTRLKKRLDVRRRAAGYDPARYPVQP